MSTKKREAKTPEEIKGYLARYYDIRKKEPDRSNISIAEELGVRVQDLSNWRRGPHGDGSDIKKKKASGKPEIVTRRRKRKQVELVTNLVPGTPHNLVQKTQSTIDKILQENTVISMNPAQFIGQLLGEMILTLQGGKK